MTECFEGRAQAIEYQKLAEGREEQLREDFENFKKQGLELITRLWRRIYGLEDHLPPSLCNKYLTQGRNDLVAFSNQVTGLDYNIQESRNLEHDAQDQEQDEQNFGHYCGLRGSLNIWILGKEDSDRTEGSESAYATDDTDDDSILRSCNKSGYPPDHTFIASSDVALSEALTSSCRNCVSPRVGNPICQVEEIVGASQQVLQEDSNGRATAPSSADVCKSNSAEHDINRDCLTRTSYSRTGIRKIAGIESSGSEAGRELSAEEFWKGCPYYEEYYSGWRKAKPEHTSDAYGWYY